MNRPYFHLEDPERQLIFVLTEKCNLDCVYCYEKHKNRSNKTLSADFIKVKIRQEMLANNECKDLVVVFFGGEPLLEFDTIREVVDWFLNTSWPSPAKSCRFMVETNGTLLNDYMKQWFTAHREQVTVSLSLDVPKTHTIETAAIPMIRSLRTSTSSGKTGLSNR